MAFFTRRPENEDNDYTLFLLEDQPKEAELPVEGDNQPMMFFEEELTPTEPIETDWHTTIDSFAEPKEGAEAEDEAEAEAETDKPAGGKPQHAAPAKRTFRQWLVDIFVPMRGDDVLTIVRKAVAILCVIGILVSLGWLFNDLWLVPVKNEKLAEDLARLYDPEVNKEFASEVEEFDQYPEGMDPAFRALYYSNPDIRGWITYPSTSKEWYGINYPVVQAADNDKYLYRDFYGDKNKNGTLFFDSRNSITPQGNDQSVIIYGHNMLSGQMFASLNKLLMNVGMARSAPTLSMNTLYQQADYKVFAVFIWDNENPGGFNYMRNSFSSDTDFMNYVEEIRMRSWYDYDAVDVLPTDELLVLSTCSNTSQTHLSDGRTVVVARKVRPNESVSVNVNQIVNNEDVLQPIAWYKAEKLPVPEYYADEQGSHNTGASSTTTTTKPTVGKDPNVLSLNLQHDEGVSGYMVTVNGKAYDPITNPIKKATLVEIRLILNDGYEVVSWNGQASSETVYTIPNVQEDIQLVVDTVGSSTDKTSASHTQPTGKPTGSSTTTSTESSSTESTSGSTSTESTSGDGSSTETGSATESTSSTDGETDTTSSSESETASTETTTTTAAGGDTQPSEGGDETVTE